MNMGMNGRKYRGQRVMVLLKRKNHLGLQLFVHTVNDEVKQKEFLGKNMGSYTDKKL